MRDASKHFLGKSVYRRLSHIVMLLQLLGLVLIISPVENWWFFFLLASLVLLECLYIIYVLAYWWYHKIR